MTKKQVYQILSNIFFLAIGIILLYYAFRGQDLDKLYKQLQNVNYFWIFPVFIALLAGHIIRAERWRMLIKTLGYRPSLFSSFNALMFGYLVSLAIPRLGEISRCIALKKKEKIPFNNSFGVVITERVTDVFMLLLLIGLTLLLKYDLVHDFFYKYLFIPILTTLKGEFFNFSIFMQAILILIILIAMVLILWFFIVQIKKIFKNKKANNFIEEIARGVLSIIKLKNKSLFLLYTVLIWICYFFTTYFWFFAQEPTAKLGLTAGIVINVISNVARIVPIQGAGMGAYHFLVTKGLGLYGINAIYGNILAILNHGALTLFQILFGIIGGLWSFLSISFTKKNLKI